MAVGLMEVLLVNARGLGDTDIIGRMDPYVVVKYKNQEHRTSVARGQGGNPVWTERLIFRVEYPGNGRQYKLTLKIMDKDTFTADDTIGEATSRNTPNQAHCEIREQSAVGTEPSIEHNWEKFKVPTAMIHTLAQESQFTGNIFTGIGIFEQQRSMHLQLETLTLQPPLENPEEMKPSQSDSTTQDTNPNPFPFPISPQPHCNNLLLQEDWQEPQGRSEETRDSPAKPETRSPFSPPKT